MKNFNRKTLAIGLVAGFLGGMIGMFTAISPAFAALPISIGTRFANVEVDGVPVSLENPLIWVYGTDAMLYLPAVEILERLGYALAWDTERDTLVVSSDLADLDGLSDISVGIPDGMLPPQSTFSPPLPPSAPTPPPVPWRPPVLPTPPAPPIPPTAPVAPVPHEIIGEFSEILGSDGAVINLQNRGNQRNIAESGSFRAKSGQTLILEIVSDILGGSVDLFLFDPSGREQRITIGAAETVRNIPLTAGIWQYNAFGMFWSGDISVVGRVE